MKRHYNGIVIAPKPPSMLMAMVVVLTLLQRSVDVRACPSVSSKVNDTKLARDSTVSWHCGDLCRARPALVR